MAGQQTLQNLIEISSSQNLGNRRAGETLRFDQNK
jgi:hypothetical protein